MGYNSGSTGAKSALSGSTSGTFIQFASAITTTYSVFWPSAQGSANTVLTNDGSGNLSWGSGASAGVSTLNSLSGTLSIVAGSGITVTPSGSNITIASTGGGSGTVTSVSVVSANGFAGTVATSTTTPAITLSTTITGLLKGNGTAISAATAGTDYVIPSGSITGTATNITATTNSTLTTLSALSLPYSQVTGAPAGTYQVDTFTLSGTDITNKFVTLSHTPATAAKVILLVENAPNMFFGVDFTVTGTQLGWSGLALDGILSSGDNLTVPYSS